MAAAADAALATSPATLPGGQTRTALPAAGTGLGSAVPTTGQLWPRTTQK